MDRPPHGRIRTRDRDDNSKVDGRTNILSWTVHLMDGIGRRTKIIILRWTSGQIQTTDDKSFYLMDRGGRVDLEVSVKII